MSATKLILGEYVRTLDQRFRLGIPSEFLDILNAQGHQLILAKEQTGCLSLWPENVWRPHIDSAVNLIHSKLHAGKLSQRIQEVQELGRLLSTRHKVVSVAERGRLVIPEGFRGFLSVEPKTDLIVVGAAVCVELWEPTAWNMFVSEKMPVFQKKIDALST
ncbi:MAG: division/cell wall cluster transcriptional repressor MraZ [Pirellulales bacterium]